MFERQTFGDDYWTKQAATEPILYPSGAPTSDALVRGECSIAVLLYNIAYIKKRDGAPVGINFPTDGVPLNFYATAISKTAANPNAAKLFMNWCLSLEGQELPIKSLGYLSGLKNPPVNPPGWDPNVVKTWVPNFEQYVKLREDWIKDWNKAYGYRQ
jgi:iron(III) transport system substrate-binding protein